MSHLLKEYKILVCTSPQITDLRDLLMDIVWSIQHYARPLDFDSDPSTLSAAVAASDAVILAGSPADGALRSTCELALRERKPVLGYLTDATDNDVRAFDTILTDAPEGSSIRLVQNHWQVTKECLISLNLLTRLLDGTLGLNARGAPTDVYIRNHFVKKFAALAQQWHTLNNRCEQNADLKGCTAAFVLDRYFRILAGADIRNWFLESGSSLAYMAEALTSNWSAQLSRLDITTNNILIYLELASASSVKFGLYPTGRPEDKYGATLGSLRTLRPMAPADAHPIDGAARFEIESLKDHLLPFFGGQGMIFAATSGIELNPNSAFRGPHVGGYYNMLFKRALLELCLVSGVPVMLLADEDKLPHEFHLDRCFGICDKTLPWEALCRDAPLAIACGFRRSDTERRETVEETLYNCGFTHAEPERKGQIPWPIILSNEPFWSKRKSWIRAGDRGTDLEVIRGPQVAAIQ